MKYKVSVIVPIYNSEQYLKRCLDSIVSQTLKEIEILCIDDGSTDSSVKIVEQYIKKDNRIKLYKNIENKGISYSRNLGIEKSSVDVIGFVDSDDTIDKDMYKKLYSKIKTTNSQIVLANFNYLDENSKIYKVFDKFKDEQSKEYIFSKTLANDFSPSACIGLYKKEVFLKTNITYPINRNYEDAATTYKLIYNSTSISIIEDKLYQYYDNPESITRAITKKHIEDLIFVIDDSYDFLVFNNIYDEYQKEFIARKQSLFNYQIYKLSKYSTDTTTLYNLINYLWDFIDLYLDNDELHFSKKLVWIHKCVHILKGDKYYISLFLDRFSDIVEEYIKNSLNNTLELSYNIIKQLFKDDIKKVYLYGAGDIAQKLIPEIEKIDIEILGIIDSNADNGDSLLGYEVNKFENIDFQSNVIVVASESSAYEITNFLENQGRDFEIINFYSTYLSS